ncbi:MAG: 2OG-Fe dioxygenase family protein [Alphaproteobacteria bacterium]
MSLPSTLLLPLREEGFHFVSADVMRSLLGGQGSLDDWQSFAESWNDLKTDMHMADEGRYRKRRYAVYRAAEGKLIRQPHQPHFQTLDYNPLNGGVERWFDPVEDAIGAHDILEKTLMLCCEVFGQLRPQAKFWHIEMHQFRIEALPEAEGLPTPEGIHRDGRDFVLVLMVRRENIQSGVTTIHDADKKILGSFTLTQPLDAAFVDDNRVYHGVTAVTPLNPALPAYRDVLVVTFKEVSG